MKRRLLCALTALACITSLCACSSGESSSEDESSVTLTAEQKAFKTYQSNTYVATGNNFIIEEADSITYRAYFPLENYGEYEYCFYFSNNVDSTYSTGYNAYVGMETGSYTIESAYVADGGTGVDDEITNRTEVKFDGEASKEVASGETFWSDPVTLSFDEGHYIVWEWTITGENIACTNMSSLTSTTAAEKGSERFDYCDQVPIPQIIGADIKAEKTVAAIGDSITQGCQTEFMEYEFWAARIAQALGEGYSFYNGGLGWSRASDAATLGDWVERVKSYDTVIVAFGTNDIQSGKYGADTGSTADEILDYLKTITDALLDAGCEVVVFSSPPENFEGELEQTRLELNESIEKLCEETDGLEFFDFASYLCEDDDVSKAKYGAHPNGEGGQIVADAFMEKFFSNK